MSDQRCRHCGDPAAGRECQTCDQQPADQCMTCHREVAHGQVTIQNVHFVGNSNPGMGVDADPDAFKRSER